MEAKNGTTVRLLGDNITMDWEQTDDGLIIKIPEKLADPVNSKSEHAWVFRIEAVKPVKKPTIFPKGGYFFNKETVKIDFAIEDQEAEIRYTLDGTEPDANAILFTETFVISEPTLTR